MYVTNALSCHLLILSAMLVWRILLLVTCWSPSCTKNVYVLSFVLFCYRCILFLADYHHLFTYWLLPCFGWAHHNWTSYCLNLINFRFVLYVAYGFNSGLGLCFICSVCTIWLQFLPGSGLCAGAQRFEPYVLWPAFVYSWKWEDPQSASQTFLWMCF
jgi:hypothetical protein